MLITKHFVFIHTPKTGGTFIRDVCKANLPADWIVEHDVSGHAGVKLIPAAYRALPRFSLVRNPWDWYVSWYHYQVLMMSRENPPPNGPKPAPIWYPASENGARDFHSTIMALSGDLLDRIDEGYHRRMAKIMKSLDMGLFTAYYRNIVRGIDTEPTYPDDDIFVGKMETLRTDFLEFLRRFDIPVTVRLVDAIRDAPKSNVGNRDTFSRYYDDELRLLIANRDRDIIKEFGYSFGTGQ